MSHMINVKRVKNFALSQGAKNFLRLDFFDKKTFTFLLWPITLTKKVTCTCFKVMIFGNNVFKAACGCIFILHFTYLNMAFSFRKQHLV